MIGSMLRKAMFADGGCTATAAPDAPYDLTSSSVTSSAITLNWDDATQGPNEATSYEVGISDDSVTWTTVTINAPASVHTFSGLSSGTTYEFRIRGVNCFGTGSYDGESFSETTAAGSIGPDWSLDFSSGTPSGYTLTRASSGTYVDSSGYIASAATDVARLTHNSSGTRLGLLVEESRTNIFQQSNAFDNAYWNDVSNSTVSNQSSPVAPNNSTETARLRETTASGIHARGRNSITPTPGRVTFSAYLKQETRQYAGLYFIATNTYNVIFDLTNGTFSAAQTSGTPNGEYSIVDVGNGWYRCSITLDTGGSGTPPVFPGVFLSDRAGFSGTLASNMPSYTGSTSEGVYVWGLQVEQAGTATSLIPTTTASVTRSADLAHVLDSSITSWGDPGALVVHFYPPGKAGTLLSTDDASTAQVGIEASSTTAARAFWSSGSTSTGTIGSSGVQKAVHYWNGSTSKFCINGGTVQSGTNNLTIGNTDFVTLGAEATDSSNVPGTFSQYANCVIRKVEFYSGTLTDANLQTVTT
jgi:hypothetical protein